MGTSWRTTVSTHVNLVRNFFSVLTHGSLMWNIFSVSTHGSLIGNIISVSTHGSLMGNILSVLTHGNLMGNPLPGLIHGNLARNTPCRLMRNLWETPLLCRPYNNIVGRMTLSGDSSPDELTLSWGIVLSY